MRQTRTIQIAKYSLLFMLCVGGFFSIQAQISGTVTSIQSGHVVVIDVMSGDTLAYGEIEDRRFHVELNRQPDSSMALPAMLMCLRKDRRSSISVPVALEQVQIYVTIGVDQWTTYSGSPLQNQFSAFISRYSEIEAQLQDQTSQLVQNSIQNEMGHELEQFYLDNRLGKLWQFTALLLTDAVRRRLVDPRSFRTIPMLCAEDTLQEWDKLMCDQIEKFNQDWIGLPYIDFDGILPDGSPLDLQDRIGGKIILLDFWASWCGPCIQEMPELKELYSEGEVEIIGISIDSGKAAWQKNLEKLNLPWFNIWDENGRIAKLYNVTSVPAKFVIDKNGIIVARNPDDLRRVLQQLQR